ncbi:MAG: hypothetical protein O9293_10300 [Porphyrobacter sp.]|nr:hypothetical protein [Porphyrobacter sp.]
MSFLSGLIGKAAKFDKSLSQYELFAFPHAGKGIDLSEAQRVANLDWFLRVKDERCQLFLAAMAAAGVHLPEPGDVTDHHALTLSLDTFARSTLDHVRQIDRICAPGWRERRPEEREAAILSFVIDLGIYCGECARSTPLGFDWRIDDTRYRRNDWMPTAGCVTLSHISNRGPQRLYHDVIEWAVFRSAQNARASAGKTIRPVNSFAFLGDLMDARY